MLRWRSGRSRHSAAKKAHHQPLQLVGKLNRSLVCLNLIYLLIERIVNTMHVPTTPLATDCSCAHELDNLDRLF
jgi:hypothetical protein